MSVTDFADLCDLAREFNEYVPPERADHGPASAPSDATGDRPGDDFNRRGEWADILLPHGWAVERTGGPVTYWRRPEKARGVSATTGKCTSDQGGDLLYVFSTNAAPLEFEKAYSKFRAYTLLDHGGDYAAAAGALRAAGYGGPLPDEPRVVFGPDGSAAPPPTGGGAPPPGDSEEWSHDALLDAEFGPLKYIVHELIADESLTILGGVQKGGKSWMAVQIAQCVAAGGEVFGRATATGPVIYLALEDGARRLQDRLKKQGTARGLPIRWVTKFPKVDAPAGWAKLCDMAAGKPRLLIVDTLAAAKSGKTDESDSGPMADLFNGLRAVAQKHRIAVLVVHHHGKTITGDPAHDLRGSSAIGAAADVLLGLYRVRRRKSGEAAQKADGHDPDDEASPDFYLKARGRDIEDITLPITFGANADWLWKLSPGGHDGRRKRSAVSLDGVHAALTQLGAATVAQLVEAGAGSESTVRRRLKELVEDGTVESRLVATEADKPSCVFFLRGAE